MRSLVLLVVISLFSSCKCSNDHNTESEVENETFDSDVEYAEIDSVEMSNEIKHVLKNPNNDMTPLDYLFAKKELSEMEVDTLYYDFARPKDAIDNYGLLRQDTRPIDSSRFKVFNTVSNQSELTIGEDIENLNNLETWFLAESVNQSGLLDSVENGVVGFDTLIQKASATWANEDYFGKDLNVDTIQNLSIPKPEWSFTYEQVENAKFVEDLKKFGFSEVVGESLILDFLIKNPETALNVIDKNPELLERFNQWVKASESNDLWLSYSDDFPAEIHIRKLEYLDEQLKNSKHKLAKEALNAINNIQIVEDNFDY